MGPTNSHFGTLASLILLSAAALGTTPVLAASPLPPNSLRVSYVRADVSQPASAQALYKRLQIAARMVCDDRDSHDLSRLAVYKHCVDHALDTAVAAIDAAPLTALHSGKTQARAKLNARAILHQQG